MELKLNYSHVSPAKDHKGSVRITRLRAGANFWCYVYQCSPEEDFDGAPDAYGWDNPTPVAPRENPDTSLQRNVNGRDHIGNATSRHQVFDAHGHDFAYVGLYATDQTTASRLRISIDRRPRLEARRKKAWVQHTNHGRTTKMWESVALRPADEGYFPVIQGAGQPAPGHYVSTTSVAADTSFDEWDQRRWVNANVIPYAAYAGWWGALQVERGDIGISYARDTGAATAFVFADTGSGHVGEVSHRALEKLTGLGGTNESKSNFIVFPHSGRGATGLFTLESAVEARARDMVLRLNNVEGADELLALMSFDMNLDLLNAWARGRRGTDANEIATAGRYDTAAMVLSSYGFSG